MKLEIETINHVGLVVRDRFAADRFYVDILGFERHPERPWWLLVNSQSTIHLIHLAEVESSDSLQEREVDDFDRRIESRDSRWLRSEGPGRSGGGPSESPGAGWVVLQRLLVTATSVEGWANQFECGAP